MTFVLANPRSCLQNIMQASDIKFEPMKEDFERRVSTMEKLFHSVGFRRIGWTDCYGSALDPRRGSHRVLSDVELPKDRVSYEGPKLKADRQPMQQVDNFRMLWSVASSNGDRGSTLPSASLTEHLARIGNPQLSLLRAVCTLNDTLSWQYLRYSYDLLVRGALIEDSWLSVERLGEQHFTPCCLPT